MRRECRERFPRHHGFAIPTRITAHVTHVLWYMPGSLTSGFLLKLVAGKTFPAFPAHAQTATRNFTYLVRGPCSIQMWLLLTRHHFIDPVQDWGYTYVDPRLVWISTAGTPRGGAIQRVGPVIASTHQRTARVALWRVNVSEVFMTLRTIFGPGR